MQGMGARLRPISEESDDTDGLPPLRTVSLWPSQGSRPKAGAVATWMHCKLFRANRRILESDGRIAPSFR